MLCCHNAVRDRAVHALMCAKPAFCYLASSAQPLADSLADTLVVMQAEAGPGGSRPEPGLQHEATTAAVQAHTAAAEMQARGPAGEMVGPLGAEGWQGPSDEDPVSPTGSSGSALDPQLYRSALAWVIFCAKMLAVTLTRNSTMVYNAPYSADTVLVLSRYWMPCRTVQPGLYHASAMYGLVPMPLPSTISYIACLCSCQLVSQTRQFRRGKIMASNRHTMPGKETLGQYLSIDSWYESHMASPV